MISDYISSLSEHCIFGDKRLTARFLFILTAKINNLSAPMSRLFEKKQDIRQAYDFFRNPKISAPMILANERARLIEHVRQQRPPVVLAIQDTTTLNYTTNRSHTNLKHLQSANQHGMYLHSTLLLYGSGVYLGVFDQYFWSRDAETFGVTKAKRKQLPIEEKESFRWLAALRLVCSSFTELPATEVVNITDREGDIYDLLAEECPPHIHRIIRVRGDRKSVLHDLEIRPTLEKTTPDAVFNYQIMVKSKLKPKQTREAKLELRYDKLLINAPCNQPHRPPFEKWVIWVRETDCPEGEESIDWLLLTDLLIDSPQSAYQAVLYYTYRWRIEVFHKVLKSDGADVENAQFEGEETLKSAIATYSLACVQMLQLQYISRETPEKPLEELAIDEELYRVGARYLNKVANTKLDTEKPKPTISDLSRVIGHLGGFSFQKGKNMGPKTIRRGLEKLLVIMEVMETLNSG